MDFKGGALHCSTKPSALKLSILNWQTTTYSQGYGCNWDNFCVTFTSRLIMQLRRVSVRKSLCKVPSALTVASLFMQKVERVASLTRAVFSHAARLILSVGRGVGCPKAQPERLMCFTIASVTRHYW